MSSMFSARCFASKRRGGEKEGSGGVGGSVIGGMFLFACWNLNGECNGFSGRRYTLAEP